jgi:BirA family biotin operon repressor/biotin-[acetyl-CoA-carboxylase] ligase
VAGRKVAGLLLERTASGAVVLGLGLNVAGCPEALADKATSLAASTGHAWSREQLLVLLMRELGGRYDRLLADGAADLLAAQRSYEQTLGQWVRFQLRGQELTGRVLDLDAGGGLVVETETGLETLVSGEVELLRNMPDGD